MDIFTVVLVILLFPGVIFVIMVDNFTEHKPWDSWKYILYSVVSGVGAYFSLQILISLFQFLYDIKDSAATDYYMLSVWGVINGSAVKVNFKEVIYTAIASVFLSIIFIKIKTNALIHDLLVMPPIG